MTALNNAGRALARTLVASAIVAVPVATVHAQAVGISAAVRNKVELRNAATPRARPVVVRERIALKDEVQTGAASQLQILLLDRSTFTVGANARLMIDRFVYDPNRSIRSMGATVTRGAFRFVSGRAGPAAGSTITTPAASIGIRGTAVEGVVGPSAVEIASGESAVGSRVASDRTTASLIILRGPGPNTQGATRPGAIDVTAGTASFELTQPMLAIYIPGAGRPPIGPFRISAAGLRLVRDLLSPPPALALMPPATARPGGTPSDPTPGVTSANPPAAISRTATERLRPSTFGPAAIGAGIAAIIALVIVVSSSNDRSERPVSP